MQGYVWAKTPQEELFVVLVVDGKGYVPGVEGAIGLDEFHIVGCVSWEPVAIPQSQNSAPPKLGVRVPDATPECAILPFAANA